MEISSSRDNIISTIASTISFSFHLLYDTPDTVTGMAFISYRIQRYSLNTDVMVTLTNNITHHNTDLGKPTIRQHNMKCNK